MSSVSPIFCLLSGHGRCNDWALRGCKWIIIGAIAIMTCLILCQVFFRYVLNDALSWSEELARYLMVWMTFLALPIVSRKMMHASLTFITDLFKGRLGLVSMLMIQIVCLIVMGVACYYAFKFTMNGTRILSSALPFTKSWSYVAMPLGFFLSASIYLEFLLKISASLLSAKGKTYFGSPSDILGKHKVVADI